MALRAVVALALVACAAPHPVAPPAAPRPPALRLPAVARPLAYSLELRIDPAQPRFDGTVDIDLEVLAPTELLWLNATGLTIDEARFSRGPAQVVPGDAEFVGFAAPLRPGRERLHVVYHGIASDRAERGMLRFFENDRWYATALWGLGAAPRCSGMLPCFDEPQWKVPWRIAARVPPGMMALSNAKVASESGGWVRFEQTRPLPSYLIAIAVGPFDLVDAGRAGRQGTPIRIVVPHGRAKEAEFAAAQAGKLLASLEDYLDSAYPFDKLDLLALRRFEGAIELPGLITFAPGLLGDHDELVGIFLHEMAHMWFGDLVTPAWWDDIWLNESFATWITSLLRDKLDPPGAELVRRVQMRALAMDTDARPGAAPIRHEVRARADIPALFDAAILYEKGGATVRTLEHWLGPAVMQRGVHRYLAAHAYGTVTTDDLVAALAAESGRDVGAFLHPLIDRSGIPVIEGGDRAPDEHTRGYFRVKRTVEQLRAVARQPLTAPEQVALLLDARISAQLREIPVAEVIAQVPPMVRGGKPEVQVAALETLEASVPPALLAKLRPAVDRLLSPLAVRLGWQHRPDDPEAVRSLRRAVQKLAGSPAQARALAEAWLADSGTLDPDMVPLVLVAAAHDGDADLLARYRAALKGRFRDSVVPALGAFRDPKVAEAAASLVLTDELRGDEPLQVLAGDGNREPAWRLVRERFDEVVARVPVDLRTWIPGVASRFCDAGHRADVAAFFAPRLGQLGDRRGLDATLARIDACIAIEGQIRSLSAALER